MLLAILGVGGLCAFILLRAAFFAERWNMVTSVSVDVPADVAAGLGKPGSQCAGPLRLPCQPGTRCEGGSEAAVGRCVEVAMTAALGQACAPTGRVCAPGSYCRLDVNGGTCRPIDSLGPFIVSLHPDGMEPVGDGYRGSEGGEFLVTAQATNAERLKVRLQDMAGYPAGPDVPFENKGGGVFMGSVKVPAVFGGRLQAVAEAKDGSFAAMEVSIATGAATP